MTEITIEPRMPQHGYREARDIERQRKRPNALSKTFGMTFRDRCDQVGIASQRDRRGKATHYCSDPALMARGLHSLVDLRTVEATSKDLDVICRGILFDGDPGSRQGMTLLYHANPTILKEREGSHLRCRRLVDDPRLDVDLSLAQRGAFLVRLGEELEDDPRCFPANLGNEAGRKCLHKAFAGSKREPPVEAAKIELFRRSQDGVGAIHHASDLASQL